MTYPPPPRRVVVALFALAIPALATAQVSRKTVYYDVTGTTVEAIRASREAGRPTDDAGAKHQAVTNWHVRWQFRSTPSGGSCMVSSITVTTDITVIMPRLANQAAVPSNILRDWQLYVNSLESHEDGHVTIATQAGSATRDAVVQVRRPTCAEVDRVVNETGRQVTEQYRAKQRAYDAETQHGIKQGVRFPQE